MCLDKKYWSTRHTDEECTEYERSTRVAISTKYTVLKGNGGMTWTLFQVTQAPPTDFFYPWKCTCLGTNLSFTTFSLSLTHTNTHTHTLLIFRPQKHPEVQHPVRTLFSTRIYDTTLKYNVNVQWKINENKMYKFNFQCNIKLMKPIFILYFAYRASQYIYLNINQLDALNFIMSLFHASTCFEHMCSSSGGQNCTIQHLVSSHL